MELSKTLGCVRKVYNLALAARAEAWTRQERVNYGQTSAMLTAWKQTEELAYLAEVSCVPLQQALRHLQSAFTAFWRLARAQRALSRTEKGSKNRAKARIRVARIHARIADRRRDHLHKLTTRLVRENQTLVIDGRRLVVVDRWFPSTHLCSACGARADRMPLSVRAWTCANCGATHDRDGNAAINLLAAGLAVIACGAGAGPRRDPSRTRRPATKQEAPPARVGPPSL
ncbi:transposase [Streptomyces sp. NPDC060028]|uniref:transposase n=1 Tax=Streptomyces sp. NPDC060028 TaxID=3347041 RepID=UPI0036AE6DA7